MKIKELLSACAGIPTEDLTIIESNFIDHLQFKVSQTNDDSKFTPSDKAEIARIYNEHIG
jgi:hypothetical protein